jgi:hypothetical protein
MKPNWNTPEAIRATFTAAMGGNLNAQLSILKMMAETWPKVSPPSDLGTD